MNTNQDITLTNMNEATLIALYKIHAYIPNDAAGNPLTPFGNFCEGYQAATKASEQRIQKLVEDNRIFVRQNVSLAKENFELTVSNNQLREALERMDGWLEVRHLGGLMPNEKELLKTTAAQSLAEHDNELIERCALKVEKQFDKKSVNWIVCHAFAEAIRALKVTI